jgi:dihydrofolate reductase
MELRLMVFPVLLGQGKRLFPEGEAKLRLQLTETKTVGNGISLVRYERARRS